MLNLENEINYITARSSGAGGQNVNKVNTKVSLRFNILQSNILSIGQKHIINQKLQNRINKNGDLIINCEQTRSQLKNKQIATKQLYALLIDALKPRKKRKATQPTKSSKLKRIKNKKMNAEKKQHRQKPAL